MIAKTTIGRSFKGCCAYNLAKVEQEQGRIVMSQGVRDYDQKAMVADFTRQAKLNPDLTRSVWHTSLSFSPQDNARLQTQPQLLQEVASDYLKGMGLEQSQYVVVEHFDTPHRHLHIIANRVRSDGKTVSDGLNYARQQKLMRQIEQRHGLSTTLEQSQRKSLKRVPERDCSRLTMRDQVRQSVKLATNGTELQAALAPYGIRMVVNRTGDGVARGLTFEQVSQDERGEKITTAFKGSKLHRELSLHHIQQHLKRNAELAQKQAQEQAKVLNVLREDKTEKTRQIEQETPKKGFRPKL